QSLSLQPRISPVSGETIRTVAPASSSRRLGSISSDCSKPWVASIAIVLPLSSAIMISSVELDFANWRTGLLDGGSGQRLSVARRTVTANSGHTKPRARVPRRPDLQWNDLDQSPTNLEASAPTPANRPIAGEKPPDPDANRSARWSDRSSASPL